MVLMLARDVRGLRPQAAELKRRKVLPYVGQWVPTVQARGTAGDMVTVGETTSGRTQVLFFLTASCPYCKQNLPKWKAVQQSLQRDSMVDVLWVSMSNADSTADYAREHGIAKVYRIEDLKSLRLFRVKVVPVTMVVDEAGQITHVHGGVISSAQQSDSIVRAARRPRQQLPVNSGPDTPSRAAADATPNP